MKIIAKKDSNKKDWSLVQEGDLFRIGGDSDIYMKIEDNLTGFNAILLKDGILVTICCSNVYSVNAHLVEE